MQGPAWRDMIQTGHHLVAPASLSDGLELVVQDLHAVILLQNPLVCPRLWLKRLADFITLHRRLRLILDTELSLLGASLEG
jgi:hypothetical protein